MMRFITFGWLGPIGVFVATCRFLWGSIASHTEITLGVAMMASLFSLPISMLLGVVDACLALVMSKLLEAPLAAAAGAIFLRAPLMAALGAIVVHWLFAPRFATPESGLWTEAAATYAGVCSLLATNWLAMRRTEEPEGPAPGP